MYARKRIYHDCFSAGRRIFLSASHTHDGFLYSIPSEILGFPYLVCKERFSAIFTNADKSFLAYSTGISVNPTGARKWRLTRECKTTLVHDVRTSIVTFYVILHVLTSFSANRFNVNILDRKRIKHFLIKNVVISVKK